MEVFEFFIKIVEQQGILALLLLIMMKQNSKERLALLKKICTLDEFIMECLRLKLAEDRIVSTSVTETTKSCQTVDTRAEATITHQDSKVEPCLLQTV